jgi:hypothetical protein
MDSQHAECGSEGSGSDHRSGGQVVYGDPGYPFYSVYYG